jgi:hypothetical protein
MSISVKEIEQAVAEFNKDQMAEFRAWYEKFDSDAWDRQIEEDVAAGKLDALADAAIADHKAGRTKKKMGYCGSGSGVMQNMIA